MEENKVLIQDLIDAGCPQEVIEAFTNCTGDNDYKRKLQILSKQRRTLVNDIHEIQKKVDCLDYLICSIKTEHNEKVI
ncbi:hypothetical protein [[Clostridium] fimetarium]|uniref:SAM-dependent MTase RsmB/NOP-type domain-containing protein n=1 Tax=[Clostridium] fimetarium TaxID=99656 RepID=A0A1I0Q5I0_9FIRM|nr:hypothetical protein [[Clostridium] fimetarium]SEW22204.1 hypothetical protein SAMN05421659_1077 [[Clostridium] fimetarium]